MSCPPSEQPSARQSSTQPSEPHSADEVGEPAPAWVLAANAFALSPGSQIQIGALLLQIKRSDSPPLALDDVYGLTSDALRTKLCREFYPRGSGGRIANFQWLSEIAVRATIEAIPLYAMMCGILSLHPMSNHDTHRRVLAWRKEWYARWFAAYVASANGTADSRQLKIVEVFRKYAVQNLMDESRIQRLALEEARRRLAMESGEPQSGEDASIPALLSDVEMLVVQPEKLVASLYCTADGRLRFDSLRTRDQLGNRVRNRKRRREIERERLRESSSASPSAADENIENEDAATALLAVAQIREVLKTMLREKRPGSPQWIVINAAATSAELRPAIRRLAGEHEIAQQTLSTAWRDTLKKVASDPTTRGHLRRLGLIE